MAAKKLLLRFFLFSCLIYSPTFFTRITAVSPLREPDSLDSHSLKSELNHLKSRISILESTIEERNHELRGKDESIGQMERIIQEKSDTIASLQSEIESFQVQSGCLPRWLAVHLGYFQAYTLMHWNEHGRPTFHLIIQKVVEHKAEIKKWAEPHIKTIATKWLPSVIGQWLTFIGSLEPHVQSVTAKTFEVCQATKSSIVLHVIKVQKMADPYIQETKKFTQPYFDQLNIVAEPFLDKVSAASKPYTNNTALAYRKFVETATLYHWQYEEEETHSYSAYRPHTS
ncbi:hypothetical protein CJ030_MR8G020396 [Morella rubra]|uniref:Uncharacterized protein n=1 Tax=Morella rubra TaxID=262757 RepID=A0A6A1UV35_9ROSI|nr:hypothetical protein CJ030_MR8G020396 [Morella rubra]